MNNTVKPPVNPKLHALKVHSQEWSKIFNKKVDDLFKSFGAEPLTNKTAIVCTAALIKAIYESASYMGSLSDEKHPYYQTDGPCRDPFENDAEDLIQFSDDERAVLLCESVSGTRYWTEEFCDAWCNSGNLAKAEWRYHAIRRKDGNEAAEKALDRDFKDIAKTPLPK